MEMASLHKSPKYLTHQIATVTNIHVYYKHSTEFWFSEYKDKMIKLSKKRYVF